MPHISLANARMIALNSTASIMGIFDKNEKGDIWKLAGEDS
jgi:hypothetical protein